MSSRPLIFLSHSSADKPVARIVAGGLESRGWETWIDDADIPGGVDWQAEVMRAIGRSAAVVLLMSHSSMGSTWVVNEIQEAVDIGLPVIPVQLDRTGYHERIHLTMSGRQRIQGRVLVDPRRADRVISQIDRALRRAERSPTRTTETRPALDPGRTSLMSFAGSVVSVLGGIGLAVGFAMFAIFGYLEVSSGGSTNTIPPPLIGFGIFVSSMFVVALGAGLRSAGRGG